MTGLVHQLFQPKFIGFLAKLVNTCDLSPRSSLIRHEHKNIKNKETLLDYSSLKRLVRF
jgi:hypothetical protein